MQVKHYWIKNPFKEDSYELTSFIDCGLGGINHSASLSKNSNGNWHIYCQKTSSTFRVEVSSDNLKYAKSIAEKIAEI